jgi:hypothetical protein
MTVLGWDALTNLLVAGRVKFPNQFLLLIVHVVSNNVYPMGNYIEKPKPDGYRGVHLIIKYRSTAKREYKDQNIEVQIRSRLQHAWATAVETCETFTSYCQMLWMRFLGGRIFYPVG